MINEYLKQLKKIKLLSPDEEASLWERYKDKDDFQARQKLITSYQPLIFKLANQFSVQEHVKMDLIQEGAVGLIDAVDSFDHQKGVRFTTYAVHHIRGRIIDHLNQGIGSEAVSLDNRNMGLTLLEKLDLGTELLEQLVEKKYLINQIQQVISELPDKERQIIREVYFMDRKPGTVAAEMEMSLSYLYRLRKRAVKRIRGKLSRFIQRWK